MPRVSTRAWAGCSFLLSVGWAPICSFVHSFIHLLIPSCIPIASLWPDDGSSWETLLLEALLDSHRLPQPPLASPRPLRHRAVITLVPLQSVSSLRALGQMQKRAEKNVTIDRIPNRHRPPVGQAHLLPLSRTRRAPSLIGAEGPSLTPVLIYTINSLDFFFQF